MANIFRKQPDYFYKTKHFIKTSPSNNAHVLANEFFEIRYFGVLKRWNGSQWVKAKMKAYGASFTIKPLKRWDGFEWKIVDNNG